MEFTISIDADSANRSAHHNQGRLSWTLRRLAAMSAPEIGFRILDVLRHARDRRRLWRFDVPPGIAGPVFPGWAEGVARLDLIPEWRTAFAAARDGRFAWFGVAWPQASPPDWHMDPMSGLRWPDSQFGPDIPYRHDRRYGDVKYVWELNRLQYLQPVAALAAVTGEDAPAELIRRHVADWIRQNPPYQGINWASGIEIGLRAVSLILVGALVDLDDALRTNLARSLAAHGEWLARYPSRFSSANNHAIAEALGLLAIGTALPQLPKAAAWATQGRLILERESLRQIYPDGVGAEQSVGYQCFTLEMLALAARLGAETQGRSPAAGAFLRAITDVNGSAPGFGDDDESRVFWSPPGPERLTPAIQQAVGAAPVIAVAPHLRQAVLDQWKAPQPVPDGVFHFPDGGYTAVREGPMHLVFDHGPLGYLSIAAHGHADALSIWLHIDGAPVLIDAGTYRYHGAGAMRDAFRGTAAHNTLTIAGADQSEIAGPFNWSRKADCKIVSIDRDRWSVEAQHDGFTRRFGCDHRRRVETNSPSGFSVIDRLYGKGGPWPVVTGFLVAPGYRVRYQSGMWHIGEKLRLIYSGPLSAEVLEAEYSPGMGHIQSTQRLLFSGSMENAIPSRFDFSLVP